MNFIILISHADCTKEFMEFNSYGEAEEYLRTNIMNNDSVEYAEIIKSQSFKVWANPDCMSEDDNF